MKSTGYKSTQTGAALVTIMVFGSIFLILTSILITTVVSQEKSIRRSLDKAVALQIAEAGLERFRWYLAHFPQDYDGPQDASINGDGEYTFQEDYFDPVSGAVTGEIAYTVVPESFCGITAYAKIGVVGTSFGENETYSVEQYHTKDTAANYAYIYNNDVRAGADRVIRGRYHSNGEIEMNGVNDSVVSSSQTDGVYGNPVNPNAREDLWQDEVGTIDFNALTIDLGTIKDAADNYNGSPTGDDANDRLFEASQSCYTYSCGWWGTRTCTSCSGTEAFEVELINDSNTDEASIRVWELENLRTIPRGNTGAENEKYCGSGSSVDFSDYDDADHDIEPVPVCDHGRTNYLGEFALDPACPVAFFKGDVFLYGQTDAKLLIGAGELDGIDTSNVYLFNNIDYESYDGSDGLTVVAEGDIKIPYSVPDDMGVRGIFVAQSGRYGRDNYNQPGWTKFDDRDFLQTVGSIVSNEGGGTQWAYSNGTFVSGFRNRENYYDRALSRRPPPLTPAVSDNYSYIEWRDQESR